MEGAKPDGAPSTAPERHPPPLERATPKLGRSRSLTLEREEKRAAALAAGETHSSQATGSASRLQFQFPRRHGRPPPLNTVDSFVQQPGSERDSWGRTDGGGGEGGGGMAGGAGGGLHANDHSRHSHGRSNVGQALLSMVRVPTPPLTPRSPHGKDDQTFSTFRKEYPPYNDWGMSVRHHWRLRAIVLVDSVVWDVCIFVMIMVNSACLAFWRPDDESYWALTLRFLEVFFQICFTYEAVIKIFALGLVGHRLSYLRDGWNVFDLIIVISGWIALTNVSDRSSVFSVLRVLRPLRILRMFPELRRLTGAVSMAVPQLINLASMGLMIFVVLSVVGQDLLAGRLRHRCYKPMGKFWEDSDAVLMLCSTQPGMGRQCPAGYECTDYGESPNYDITKFDSFPYAFLTIFQCMTQQGWSDVMYWSRQAAGSWVYAYFVGTTFLSFFIFNLIIVIIIVDYSRSQEQSAIESIKDGHITDSVGPDGKIVVKASERRMPHGPSGPLRLASSASSDSARNLRQAWAASGRPPPLALLRNNSSLASDRLGPTPAGVSRTGPLAPGGNPTSSVPDDYSELLLSKLIAIKAAAKLELLTSQPPSHTEHLQGKDVAAVTGGKIAEVALLLQRSMKHLQQAPQNNLDPELFTAMHKEMHSRPSKVAFEGAPLHYICLMLVQSPHFYHFMHAMTGVSTILLSLASYNQSQSMSDTLARLNTILILIFTLESYIKIRGLGWDRFKSDGMNTFDLIVAIISLLELFLAGQGSRLYALRCVRLLRIFSLARSWKGFRRVLSNMAYTASHSMPFLLLTAIFLFVYAIAGMTLLGGKITEPDPVTGRPVPVRANFDTFYWSVISVFQIITLDNWNSNMYQAMASSNPTLSALFYASAVLLGKYMLLNLLVAILVENYSLVQSDEVERKLHRYRSQKSSLANMQAPFEFLRHKLYHHTEEAGLKNKHMLSTSNKTLQTTAAETPRTLYEVVRSLKNSTESLAAASSQALAPYLSRRSLSSSGSKGAQPKEEQPRSPVVRTVTGAGGEVLEEVDLEDGGESEGDEERSEGGKVEEDEGRGEEEEDGGRRAFAICCGPAVWGHPAMVRVREWLDRADRACLALYEHDYFPLAMIVLVLLSCVVLAVDSPGPTGTGPASRLRVIIRSCEAITIFIMAFEQVYRVKSLGGVLTYDGSYLTRLWDWTDLLIILSAFSALITPWGSQAARTAKVVRALRPITLIPRVNGLTVVVDTLYQALRSCSGVVFVASVFYLVFAILGVNLFGGAFYSCNDPERTCIGAVGGRAVESCPANQACVGRFYDVETGALQLRQWSNPSFSDSGTAYSFDDVGSALLTLFEVASLEQWGTIMFTACDTVGPGQAPVRNANVYAALYFVAFLFIVCFFIQEIFVAVIIHNFKKIKQISNGSAFMTSQQREWVRLQKAIKFQQPRIRAPPPETQPLRRQMYHILSHRLFEPAMLVLIGINVIFMLSEHWGQASSWASFIRGLDHFFTIVYLFECVLRMLALGYATYFTSKWNRYDFFVTCWGLLMLCLGPVAYDNFFCRLVLHLTRALRIFRVIRISSRLQRLVRTFYLALPSLKNIGMFLLLILYVYAEMGNYLFSTVPTTGAYLNENANFSSFPLAFLTLIRISTGENWNGLMHECAAYYKGTATAFFCSFVILISYVMLNLFIATMLENFQEDMGQLVVTTKDIRNFSRLWTDFKKKSLRGDLTKIDNRTTKVSTPVMRREQRMSFRVSGSTAELLANAGRSARLSVGRSFGVLHRMSSSLGGSGSGKKFAIAPAADGKRAGEHLPDESLIFLRLYESSPRYVPIQFLKSFLVTLPPPLGPQPCFDEGEKITSARVLEYMRSLEVPVNRYAYVYYQDVLQAVLRRAFEVKTHIPQTMRLPFKNKRVFLAHEWYAAVAVQSAWRGRSLRHKLLTTQASTLSLSETVVAPDGRLPPASPTPRTPGKEQQADTTHPLRRHSSHPPARRLPSASSSPAKSVAQSPQRPRLPPPLVTPHEEASSPALTLPAQAAPKSPVPVTSPMATPVTELPGQRNAFPVASPSPVATRSRHNSQQAAQRYFAEHKEDEEEVEGLLQQEDARQQADAQQQQQAAQPDAVALTIDEASDDHHRRHASQQMAEASALLEAIAANRRVAAAVARAEEEGEEDWEAIREAQLVEQELRRVVEQDLARYAAQHAPEHMEDGGGGHEDGEDAARRRSPVSPRSFLSARRSPPQTSASTPPRSPGRSPSRSPRTRSVSRSPRSPRYQRCTEEEGEQLL